MNTKLIFKGLVGSRAYGTNIETSDYDYKGIYVQDIYQVSSGKYKEQIDIGKDETYYEVKRFVELLASANPTTLELLYVEPLEMHPVYQILLDNRESFLTKRCLDSFGGYAVAQLKKARGLNKKMNWENSRIERKGPIDFCIVFENGKTFPILDWLKRNGMLQEHVGLAALDRMPNCYAVYYDWSAQYGLEINTPISPIGYRGIAFEDSNDIRLSSIPKGSNSEVVMYYNKDAYSAHCKDYLSYQTWLKNRNEARYINIKNHNQKIDGKNMLHCVRMLHMAEEIVKEKTIKVLRPDAEFLMSIRRGEQNLEEVIQYCEDKLKILTTLYANCDLPNSVSQDLSYDIISTIRKNIDI